MKNAFFFSCHIHLYYIFHSCTVSENNGYLNFPNSYLAFCFAMTTLFQLGVYRQVLLNSEETKFSRIEHKAHTMRDTVEKSYKC